MLTDRMTYGQIALVRRLCAGESLDRVAAERGVTRESVLLMRRSAMVRTPMGTTLEDVCRELSNEVEARAKGHANAPPPG